MVTFYPPSYPLLQPCYGQELVKSEKLFFLFFRCPFTKQKMRKKCCKRHNRKCTRLRYRKNVPPCPYRSLAVCARMAKKTRSDIPEDEAEGNFFPPTILQIFFPTIFLFRCFSCPCYSLGGKGVEAVHVGWKEMDKLKWKKKCVTLSTKSLLLEHFSFLFNFFKIFYCCLSHCFFHR